MLNQRISSDAVEILKVSLDAWYLFHFFHLGMYSILLLKLKMIRTTFHRNLSSKEKIKTNFFIFNLYELSNQISICLYSFLLVHSFWGAKFYNYCHWHVFMLSSYIFHLGIIISLWSIYAYCSCDWIALQSCNFIAKYFCFVPLFSFAF